MRGLLAAFSGLLLLASSSCGDAVSPLVPVVEPKVETPSTPAAPTLASRMVAEEPPQLVMLQGDGVGSVDSREVQRTTAFTRLPLHVAAGNVVVHAVDNGAVLKLQLKDFVVRLGDMAVLGTGLTVTDLHFTLTPEELVPLYFGDTAEQAYATVPVTLTVSGSLKGASAAPTPFESQRFSHVPLALELGRDESHGVTAHFTLHSQSFPTWSWANLLETGEAGFEGWAAEEPGSAHAL